MTVEPPTGVVIVYRDGRRMPVECSYVGVDPVHHTHVWMVTSSVVIDDIARVSIEELPAMTTVVVENRSI